MTLYKFARRVTLYDFARSTPTTVTIGRSNNIYTPSSTLGVCHLFPISCTVNLIHFRPVIYRFATSRKLKRNQPILTGFVSLTCNYRSNKWQFSLLPSNLRGRQASYHLNIDLCADLFNIIFVYNKLSCTNSVFYYHCEKLRAHRPEKWQRTHK